MVQLRDLHLHAFKRVMDRHIRLFAIIIAVVSGAAALIFVSPQAIGLMASPLAAASAPAPFQAISITFQDAEGNVIGHRGGVAGRTVPLEQMPPYLPASFIAMEDRRFYHHHGLDFLGLSRAAYLDLKAGRYVAGGSTITQQTAKIMYAGSERTLGRKARELVDAARLENALTKKQILQLYLNRIYLGDTNIGVDSAARDYFGIPVQKVTLAQAALLAGLTRSPARFSPRRDLAAARFRAARVLQAMVKTGAISAQEAAYARAHPADIVERSRDTHSYFLDAAFEEVQHLLPQSSIPQGGLVVKTSFDPAIQQIAEAAAEEALRKSGAKLKFSQVATVVMNPNGAILALVGGKDYGASEFDRVTQAHRQPGSAFKPFVYLAAMEAGISPWDWRDDQPVDIDGYQPANYRNETYGRLRLTDALAHSVNTITVNLAQEVGVANVAGAARQLGIASPLQDNASLALGTNEVTPLELTAAYCAFANGGHAVTPYFVSRIQSADGDVLYERNSGASAAPVISDQVRRDMTAMLFNVVVSGTGTAARLPGREAGGKTGTTQDYRDAWFVGFTSDYVAGVWLGNDDNSPMRSITGGSLPAQIWKEILAKIEQGQRAMPLDRSPVPAEVTDNPSPEALTASLSDERSAAPQAGVLIGSGTAPRAYPRQQDYGANRQEQDLGTDQPPRVDRLARSEPVPRTDPPIGSSAAEAGNSPRSSEYVFMPDGSILRTDGPEERAAPPPPIIVDRSYDPYFR